jgi:hypothetical protein
VIVCLDLHQDVDELGRITVLPGHRIWHEARSQVTFDHGRVVRVGRQHAPRARFGALLDQLEQRFGALFAVDHEVGVEDLVPAVLAVRLREHHQLHVRRVATERGVAVHQVFDLVFGERQTETLVRFFQRALPRREVDA